MEKNQRIQKLMSIKETMTLVSAMRMTKEIPDISDGLLSKFKFSVKKHCNDYTAEEIIAAKHFSLLLRLPFNDIYVVERVSNETRFNHVAAFNKLLKEYNWSAYSFLGDINLIEKVEENNPRKEKYAVVETGDYLVSYGRHQYLISASVLPESIPVVAKGPIITLTKVGSRVGGNQYRFTDEASIEVGKRLSPKNKLMRLLLQVGS